MDGRADRERTLRTALLVVAPPVFWFWMTRPRSGHGELGDGLHEHGFEFDECDRIVVSACIALAAGLAAWLVVGRRRPRWARDVAAAVAATTTLVAAPLVPATPLLASRLEIGTAGAAMAAAVIAAIACLALPEPAIDDDEDRRRDKTAQALALCLAATMLATHALPSITWRNVWFSRRLHAGADRSWTEILLLAPAVLEMRPRNFAAQLCVSSPGVFVEGSLLALPMLHGVATLTRSNGWRRAGIGTSVAAWIGVAAFSADALRRAVHVEFLDVAWWATPPAFAAAFLLLPTARREAGSGEPATKARQRRRR